MNLLVLIRKFIIFDWLMMRRYMMHSYTILKLILPIPIYSTNSSKQIILIIMLILIILILIIIKHTTRSLNFSVSLIHNLETVWTDTILFFVSWLTDIEFDATKAS